MDGQEIGGQIAFGDEGQFLVEQGLDLGRRAFRIADRDAAADQFLQPALRRPIGRDGFFRVFILQVVQVEINAREKGDRLGHGLRGVLEQAGHFGGRFQPAFGVGLQPAAGSLDGGSLADTGQDILKITLRRAMEKDVVDGQQRQARVRRQGM
ncbi:hypothetical protein D3C87_1687930 [compost metagenome]